jgi:uncharacterized protein YraI
MRRNNLLLPVLISLVLSVVGCTQLGPQATPAPPTKTPKPTFTFTPEWTPTPMILPTATPIPATPTPEATATPAATDTPTEAPVPRFTTSRTANVRSGPGVNYARIGSLGAGEAGVITGKNPAGNWYQFDYAGRSGWISADLVTLSGDTARIQVAQNLGGAPPDAPATADVTASSDAGTCTTSATGADLRLDVCAGERCGRTAMRRPEFRGPGAVQGWLTAERCLCLH